MGGNVKKGIGCFVGMHDLVNYGGADNMGSGMFRKRFICTRCGKIIVVIR